MALDWDRCPQQIEGAEVNQVADGYVVYQPDRDRIHYLNHTAVLVLELCTGKLRAREILDLVQEAYALPTAPTEEVGECLAKLLEEGLIR